MKKITKIGLLLIGIVLITGCGCSKKETKNTDVLDENEANTVIKDTKVEELDIIDFVVLFEDNISTVYFTIENNTEETKTYEKIECAMYDKNGNSLYSFEESLGTLEPLDSKEIEYMVDIDLTKVKNVEYVLK